MDHARCVINPTITLTGSEKKKAKEKKKKRMWGGLELIGIYGVETGTAENGLCGLEKCVPRNIEL